MQIFLIVVLVILATAGVPTHYTARRVSILILPHSIQYRVRIPAFICVHCMMLLHNLSEVWLFYPYIALYTVHA